MMNRELGEELAGPLQHHSRDAGQSGDVDAVRPVGAPLDDAVQEDHLVLPLADRDVEVAHAGEALGQVGQLVVVGGEQRAATHGRGDVLGNRPG